jgi:hypothetical protein
MGPLEIPMQKNSMRTLKKTDVLYRSDGNKANSFQDFAKKNTNTCNIFIKELLSLWSKFPTDKSPAVLTHTHVDFVLVLVFVGILDSFFRAFLAETLIIRIKSWKMFGNFVNNLKSRLSTRVGDESMSPQFYSTDVSRPKNIFYKLINASYSLVNQNQDDAYCSENLFMLPRVYSQQQEYVSGLWSPVSLTAPEKSLDEIDNVVEKFIRCISVENYDDDKNVNRMKNGKVFHIFEHLCSIYRVQQID